MKKNGIVESVDGSRVAIKITRDSSCGENCAMCNVCPGKDMTINILTEQNFSKGDKVKIETKAKDVLLSAFLIYILPIILLIVGYAIATLYIGLALMIISFVILLFADKKINTNYYIKVSKVL